jgi:hypothetical protein
MVVARLVITRRIRALPIWPAMRSTISTRRWIGPVKILDQYHARLAVGMRRYQLYNRIARLPTALLRIGNSRVRYVIRWQTKQLADQHILLLGAGSRCGQGIHAGAPN